MIEDWMIILFAIIVSIQSLNFGKRICELEEKLKEDK